MQGLTILVTDASYKHAVGIIRTLGRDYNRVCAVSHHRYAPGFYSRYTYRHSIVPSPSCASTRFVKSSIELGREWGTNIVIPVGFDSTSGFVHHADLIRGAGIASVLPTRDAFERCADKLRIVQVARDIGLLTPESILATGEQDIGSFLDRYRKAVAKYRRESDGQGVVYLERTFDWRQALKTKPISQLSDETPNLIVQEYISGIGQGYMALAWHGRVVREFAHRRLREFPPDGGASTAAVSIRDESLIAAGRKLIEAVGWHGPVMLEFKSNETGHYLIEFNPKYWGSLELALACGANFLDDHCRLAMGDDLANRRIPPYEVGRRFWWPWRGDLRRLLKRPGDSRHVLTDLLSRNAESNWSWIDPLPNLIEIAGELTRAFRRRN